MGHCATCGKRVGTFGRRYRRLDGGRHCLDCVPIAIERRRERTVNAIAAGPSPRVVLVAPVISRDLDYPANYRRYTGALLLTDRGVIFAQYDEYKKAHDGGRVLNLVGAAIDGFVERRRRNAACMTLDDVSDAGSIIGQATQLFFFETEDISKLKANNTSCEVKVNRVTTPFRWVDPRKSIKPHRALLDAYVCAVNARRDIMGDCELLLSD